MAKNQKTDTKAPEQPKAYAVGDAVTYNNLLCKVSVVIPDKRSGTAYNLTTPSGATVHAVRHGNVTKVS